ncbi:hypothetical protein ACXR2T_12300 [Leucobacter sp. HY1910]
MNSEPTEHSAAHHHTTFTHTERPRRAALTGPLVGLGIALAAVMLISYATGSLFAWIFTVSWVLIVAALVVFARTSVTVNDEGVCFRGPFFTRCLSRDEVAGVAVAADDGLAEGSVSWFVTREDHGARTRLNLGGAASVTVTDIGGRRTQMVVRDQAAAEEIQRAISAHR